MTTRGIIQNKFRTGDVEGSSKSLHFLKSELLDEYFLASVEREGNTGFRCTDEMNLSGKI